MGFCSQSGVEGVAKMGGESTGGDGGSVVGTVSVWRGKQNNEHRLLSPPERQNKPPPRYNPVTILIPAFN